LVGLRRNPPLEMPACAGSLRLRPSDAVILTRCTGEMGDYAHRSSMSRRHHLATATTAFLFAEATSWPVLRLVTPCVALQA
jgi:hypothetical protein